MIVTTLVYLRSTLVQALLTTVSVSSVSCVTTLGKKFTLKEVKFNFRKVCMEFWKRIDPNLPYFYHTSSHHRFSEGPLPDFDQPKTSKRKSRFSRREQPAAFVPGRATLPVRGSLSVRPQFHNKPLDLPPPPSAPIHVWEQSFVQ